MNALSKLTLWPTTNLSDQFLFIMFDFGDVSSGMRSDIDISLDHVYRSSINLRLHQEYLKKKKKKKEFSYRYLKNLDLGTNLSLPALGGDGHS